MNTPQNEYLNEGCGIKLLIHAEKYYEPLHPKLILQTATTTELKTEILLNHPELKDQDIQFSCNGKHLPPLTPLSDYLPQPKPIEPSPNVNNSIKSKRASKKQKHQTPKAKKQSHIIPIIDAKILNFETEPSGIRSTITFEPEPARFLAFHGENLGFFCPIGVSRYADPDICAYDLFGERALAWDNKPRDIPAHAMVCSSIDLKFAAVMLSGLTIGLFHMNSGPPFLERLPLKTKSMPLGSRFSDRLLFSLDTHYLICCYDGATTVIIDLDDPQRSHQVIDMISPCVFRMNVDYLIGLTFDEETQNQCVLVWSLSKKEELFRVDVPRNETLLSVMISTEDYVLGRREMGEKRSIDLGYLLTYRIWKSKLIPDFNAEFFDHHYFYIQENNHILVYNYENRLVQKQYIGTSTRGASCTQDGSKIGVLDNQGTFHIFWSKEYVNRKILFKLLLQARSCEDSPFSKEVFPLDLFKYICHLCNFIHLSIFLKRNE